MRLLHQILLNPWASIPRAPEGDGGGETVAGGGEETTAGGGETVAGGESAADTVAGAGGADTISGGDSGSDTVAGGESGSDTQPGVDMIGAPADDYATFDMPEGVTFDTEAMALAAPVLKELNISQAGAQALVSRLYIPLMQQAAERADAQAIQNLETQRANWLTEAQADPAFRELGGWDKSLTLVAAARDKFGSPELNQILEDSGLGNRVEVLKAFAKIGAAMADDGFERTGSARDTTPKDDGEVFYGDTMKRHAPA